MTTIFLATILSAVPVDSSKRVDEPTLRARAALALAFADPRPTYSGQLEKAVRERKPLLVWVGQPARHIGECVCFECEVFPGVGKEAVVIGIPAGDRLRRVDLPGIPTEAEVREAIRRAR